MQQTTSADPEYFTYYLTEHLISEVVIFEFQYSISEVSMIFFIFDFLIFNFQYLKFKTLIVDFQYSDYYFFQLILIKPLFDIQKLQNFKFSISKLTFIVQTFDILITMLYISTVTVFKVLNVKNLLWHSKR